MKLFTPPTYRERLDDPDPLWRRMSVTRSRTVLKSVSGFYTSHVDVSPESIDESLIAYLGGHVYLVDDAEAGDLVEAGYGEFLHTPGGGVLRGYGSGKYGSGKYGVTEVTDPGTYGDGLFGDGLYGE